ncbi:MAG: SpvB/TcaC N-terminal domain-containing protein [Pseudomonadota bacterium]|nr:SpvB/TcaC N-terminal domain-containing protein [Pseudomonadota bacterium]
MGEKFQANPVTGTSSVSIPLAVTPGRAGAPVSLSLSYNSGSGNGPFGLGWQLALPSVRRKTDKGLPTYRDGGTAAADDVDTFLVSDMEDLVPWTGADPSRTVTEGSTTYRALRYRPRIEGAFARIERWIDTATGDLHWRTRTRDNTVRIYGQSESARLADPGDTRRVFEWFLEEERDELGNITRYTYVTEDGASVPAAIYEMRRSPTYTYLKAVEYGNDAPDVAADFHFRVVFDYGEHDATDPEATSPAGTWTVRADPWSNFRPGFDQRCFRLCQRILMFHTFDALEGGATTLVRSTEFTYDANAVATTLTSVQVRGWLKDGGTWTHATTPPVTYGYQVAEIDEAVRFVDGLEDLPNGLDTGTWQFVDLDGEGLTGLLTAQGSTWFYKRNEGDGRFAPARALGSRPSLPLGDAGTRLVDVQGDGRLDLVSMTPGLRGYIARSGDGWERFRHFTQAPSDLDWNDPNARILDLDGDGFADVLVTEDHALAWYRSDGEGGYEGRRRVARALDENEGPALAFQNGEETIFLADLNGDGLTDIVRIRNGSTCYWPNLGYGRFGAKVQLANSPWFDAPDRFDPKRIRLADVDGTGPADLLYLRADGVRLWLNEAGNSWSSSPRIIRFPSVADPAAVSVSDLLGDGTACLVWSTPLLKDAWQPLRYVKLMSGGKPYLLTTITNNLGRVTRLEYAPSTQFYTADRQAGTPWATRLPFPVHCLSRVEMRDHVTGWKFVSTYTYHHGYFDGVEREFRGFGRVDQRDTEALGDFEDHEVTNANATTHADPVLTRTWFHTGAWRDEPTLESAFETEYWNGDSEALRLAACDALGTLTPREARDAARGFKGQMLRQEVYAEDGTGAQARPYAVTETRYRVTKLQDRVDETPAVFLPIPRESVSRSYERLDPPDPRTVAKFPLTLDEYGTVLLEAAVSYRRRPNSDPGVEVIPEQEVTTVLVTERTVLHDDTADRLHLAMPTHEKVWQLTGTYDAGPDQVLLGEAEDTATDRPLSAELLAAAFAGAAGIDYTETPTSFLERRKLSDVRTRYWNGALTAAEAATSAPAKPLVYERYQLAFPADLLTSAYGTRVTDPMLEEAGYVEYEADGAWWIPSGKATPVAARFYQPEAFEGPFGGRTEIDWDDATQLVTEARQLVWTDSTPTDHFLTVSVTSDYRILAPSTVTEPNGTTQSAAFDALGRVVKTWVARGSLGDTEANSTAEVTYELDRWLDEGLPVRVHARAYETHWDSSAALEDDRLYQDRYTYSDGGGNVVQEKGNAAPGEAPERDLDGNLVFIGDELQWADVNPRWIGTGRTVVDNKGNVIRQYEPFFSATHEYEYEDAVVEWGVSPTFRYDPLGRNIRVDMPNGTLRRIVLDPWRQESWDENDTVLESTWYDERIALASTEPEYRAATLAAAHADTPTVTLVDAMGRPVRTREYLTEVAYSGNADPTTDDDAFETRVVLYVQGTPREVIDARQVTVQEQQFDLLGRPMLTESPDGGDVWTLLDLAGQPVRVWKSGDLMLRFGYDAMRRRTRHWVTEGVADERLVERAVYGERVADAADTNLLGRVYVVYDTAGAVTAAYDYEGRPASQERVFWDDVDATVDWTDLDDATDPEDPADIETAVTAMTVLEGTTYTTTTLYDALGRVTSQTTPDASETLPGYNRAGLLETVDVKIRGSSTATSFVTTVTYDAKGQRLSIVMGEGLVTQYTYDPLTYRLMGLITTRPLVSPESTDPKLQDLSYTYDPVGNIVRVEDASQDDLYFNNTAVRPVGLYSYDAVYRLVTAEGRERVSQGPPGSSTGAWTSSAYGAIPDASNAVWEYTESYDYDKAGNILGMDHSVPTIANENWSREYEYETASNRLIEMRRTTVADGTITDAYTHDSRGNIVRLPHLRASVDNVLVDFRDQMRQVLLASSGDDAVYLYDASGQRVRKIVRTGANVEDRRYVGGFEAWTRTVGGTLDEARETVHVMDGKSRIAMIETTTCRDELELTPAETRLRFQLVNHLGTAMSEVTADGALISYEEYHPYGSTAWHAFDASKGVSGKRYRYTGMERDEETGLQYHSARYYAPWLGRWMGPDPIGLGDGSNRFAYTHGNPIGSSDPSGLFDWSNPVDELTQRAGALAAVVEDEAVSFGYDWLAGAASIYSDPGTVASELAGDAGDLSLEIISHLPQYQAGAAVQKPGGSLTEGASAYLGTVVGMVAGAADDAGKSMTAPAALSQNLGMITSGNEALIREGIQGNLEIAGASFRTAGNVLLAGEFSSPLIVAPGTLTLEAITATSEASVPASLAAIKTGVQAGGVGGAGTGGGVSGAAARAARAPKLPVVAGEGGKFSALDARRVKGDALTPHHLPQVAAEFTARADGGALVMQDVEHALTRTFAGRGAATARAEAGMSFRAVLARDIVDVRGIVGTKYNQGLLDVIAYYRTNYPGLMQR